jgi:hypothetical protein
MTLETTEQSSMASLRKVAIVAGSLYLVTHVTSIAGLLLYGPVLHNPEYVLGGGADSRIILGAFLEIILAMANIGTAVTLFPVTKKQNESISLGYVGLRILEAAIICVGVVALLTVVTLRQQHAGTPSADPASVVNVGRALVAVHDWTFLVGPNSVLGINTILMAYLMYRSELVPRWIGALGLIGGTLIFLSSIAELFGVYKQVSVVGSLTAVPVFAWELSLAFWLIIKGFRPAALQRLAIA